jgi:beta-lactamase class A
VLAEEIRSIIRRAPGTLGVVVQDPSGVVVDLGGERVVPSASTIKVLVLVAALRRVADGRSRLGDLLDLPAPADRVGGSGPLLALGSVTRLRLGELLELMVTLSDNDATNVVLDLVDRDEPAMVAAELGLADTRLQRRMMDFAARDAGRENLTSARDLAALVAALRRGEALPPEQTREALEVLGRQQQRDGLPALLPPGVVCGNKTGELPGIRHDVGLLERDGRWAAVAVTATGLGDGPVDHGSVAWPSIAAVGAVVGAWLSSGTGRTGAPPGPRRP